MSFRSSIFIAFWVLLSPTLVLGTCDAVKELSVQIVTFNANHAEISDKTAAWGNLHSALAGVVKTHDVVSLMLQELLHDEFPALIKTAMATLGYTEVVSSAISGKTKALGHRVETSVAVFTKTSIHPCFVEAEPCARVHMAGKGGGKCTGFDPKVILGIETKFAEVVEFEFKGRGSFVFAGVHMSTGGSDANIKELMSALNPHKAQFKVFAGDFNTRIPKDDKAEVCEGDKFSAVKFLKSFNAANPGKIWDLKDTAVMEKGGWSIVPPGTALMGGAQVVLPTYKYTVGSTVMPAVTEHTIEELFGKACKDKKVNLGVLDRIAVYDLHKLPAQSFHSETFPVAGSDHALVTSTLTFPLAKAAAQEASVMV